MKNNTGFTDYHIGLVVNPKGKLAVKNNAVKYTVVGFKLKAFVKANYILPVLSITSLKR